MKRDSRHCTAPMGIAVADLRRNLADFPPDSEFLTVGHVGLLGEMPITIAAQAEPGLPGA
jgi:hypothetical protein